MSGVFLLDDHAFFRRSLAFLLEQDPYVELVAQAGSLAEARQTTSKGWDEIDLAIVDLLLPDGSGTELIREMREANPRVRVIVLTIVQESEALRKARAMGVDAVISKAAPIEEIRTTIRHLARSERARIGR